jgi:creatine kinase/arginine kinase
LEAAGFNKDWPEGRGIFHTHDKSLLIWINEEDHIRIISMTKGFDLKAVFEKLVRVC